MPTFNPTNASGKTGTIQTWTVPFTANWTIEAWGAQGGGTGGGFGAHAKATITLNAGQQLKILVGQQGVLGTWSASVGAGGGGGGSFVTLNDNTPLVVAGGGGGSGQVGGSIDGPAPGNLHANTGTAGRTDTRNVNVGGTNGSGGLSSSSTSTYSGSGGGGLTGDGQGGTHSSYSRHTAGAGKSFTNGGTGGDSWNPGGGSPGYGGEGGFGGGGGGTYSAGGGGGYSGGGGHHQTEGGDEYRRAGGGGGSFVAAGATDTLLEVGSRTGAGVVIITPGTPPTLSNLFSGSINPLIDSIVTWTYSDAESNPQASYQIGWRKQGSGESHHFYEYQSANPYHTIPAGTLEEGVTYDWAVRVKDSNGLWSDYSTSQFTSISPYRISTAVNIVPNPSAEISTTGWSTGVTLERSTAKASSGVASFRLSRTNLGNINISRRLDASPGQKFIIRAKFAAGAGVTVPRTARLDYAFEKADTTRTYAYTVLTSASVPIDGSWIELAATTVEAPALTEKLFIVPGFIDVVSGEYFHIDDIQVIAENGNNQLTPYFDGDSTANNAKFYWLGEAHNSPSVSEVFAYENFVRNPDFIDSGSNGLADGFSKYAVGTYSIVTSPWGNGNAQRFIVNGNAQDTRLFYGSNRMPVAVGETVTFLSRYTGPGRISSGIEWFNASGGYNGGSYKAIAPDADGWVRHTAVVTPGTTACHPMYYTGGSGLANDTHTTTSWLLVRDDYTGPFFGGNTKEGSGEPNLFTNSSVETNLTGLGVNRVTLSRSSDWASDGLWSVKATRTADTSTDSYIELLNCLPGGAAALQPDTTYTIAATYKLDDKFSTAPDSGSGLNQRLSIFVHLNNTSRGIVTGINKNNQTERLRLVFTTPSSFVNYNTIRLYAGGSPGEYIYWDDWALYEGDVETFDGEGNLFSWTGNADNSNSIRTTYGSWKQLSEVSSTTASGIIAANKLQPGDYEVQVAAQDADAIWGEWGAPETFTLGPASNLLVKSGGTFATGLRLVKQGGVWVETGVTKQFTEKYSDAIIASAPVGYWRLDDTSGTQANDYSGAGRHGTYVNGVSLNQDGPNKTMRSALFTRASSQHVTLPTSGLPSGNSNYSFEFWFNPTIIDELQGIVNIGSYGTPNQANAVRLTSTGGSGIHNYWWNLDATYNSTNIAINQWHHGVWTYDGANRRFYLNGALVRTVASSNAAIVIGVPTIGKTANSEYFNGRIAHVSIYNRALSAAEALDHYTKSGGIY